MKKLALLLALAPAVALAGGPNVLTLKRPPGPEWFGLYLGGKKAGWSRMEWKRERRGGREVVVATDETELQVLLQGKSVHRYELDEKVYEAKPRGRLLSFRAVKKGDGGDRTIEGRCDPAGCKVSLTAEGQVQRRELPPLAETAEESDAARLAAETRSTLHGDSLEFEELRVKKMKRVFLRRDVLAGAGVKAEVSVVAESEEDDRVPALVSVADDGRIAEISYGGVVARPESEQTAKKLDVVDLFALSRVVLPAPIPPQVIGGPGTVVYRMKGLPAGFDGSDARQTLSAEPDGTTVVTVSVQAPAAADPRRDTPRGERAKDVAPFLAATPEIDADNPEVKALAKRLAGDAKGDYAAALRLSRWVFRNVTAKYGASHDKASEVLATKEGDCTEHALLFTALARAAGIPARQVHGLVYAQYDDKVPALYWHAWAEVKSGGEWIAVDPTFNQPVADATHITLGRGTQVDTVGLMGTLAVQSLEARAP